MLYLIYINPYFDLVSTFLWNSTEKFSSRKYAFQRGTNYKHPCSMTGTINSEFQTKVKLILKYTCLTWFVSRKLSASKYIGRKKYYKQTKILIKSFYRYIYI